MNTNLPFFSKILLIFIAINLPLQLKSQVSGNVFRDINANGTLDAGELPEAGIRVVAYNSNGDSLTQVITVNTLNGGGDNYSFTGLSLPIRLEYRVPNYLFAVNGMASGTSVQFFSAINIAANLAVSYPMSYCQTNPDVIMSCFVAGNPEGGGTGGTLDALVRFPYNSAGSATAPTKVASASQIGACWGSVYQRESKKLVLSSFIKRHTGLKTEGLGGIYIANLTTAPGTPSTYIDIENYGINLGGSAIASRAALPTSATGTSADPLAMINMGKVGIGSIDLSDDGKVLWGVNLFSKEIFSFQIGNPVKPAASVSNADFASYAIPNPGCTNGVARPWAIECFEGKIYVGLICSGENAGGSQANLFAYVYKFDPKTNVWDATPVASFSLNYPKGDVHTNYPLVDKWETWTDVFTDLHDSGSAGSPAATRKMRPQPILSDIQFDKRGNMILGFMDRTGHQTGRAQVNTGGTGLFNGYIGGDLLYLKANGTGGFTLENNATFIGGPTGSSAGNNQGPGNGEFFGNDFYEGVNGSGPVVQIHQETMVGGAYYHAGNDEVMVNQMDPLAIWSGGVVRHDVSDGSSTTGMRYQIFNSGTANGTYGKANGLGMMEFICDPAPLQIGNYVWIDTDKDGIMDANEAGINNVVVKLKQGGTVVQTITTANNGQFIFTNVQPNTDYTIEIEGISTQTALNGLDLTTSNTNANADDVRDNDATVASGNAVIAYRTGGTGQNNHTLDFGFKCGPVFTGGVARDTTVCNGSSVNLATLVPNYNLLSNPTWYADNLNTPALTSTSISSTATKTYFLVASNGGVCFDTTQLTVNVNPLPTANCSGTDVTSTGGNDGTANVTVTGGTAAFSYLWSNGATTVALNNLSIGTYTVTVTDANGCTAICSKIIAQPAPKTDLRLRKTVNNPTPALNEVVIYTVKVKNESLTTATNVQVADTLAASLQYIASTPANAYNPITGIWQIGTLNAGDSTILTITAKVTQPGPTYNLAQISATNEIDIDSSPNNFNTGEDDIDQVCVTVPINICNGATWTAILPSSLTNIQWYRDNVAISGATNNTLVIATAGSYSFTADNAACPAQGCCPIVVESDCCPKPICLPISVVKN
jgi:uncharacterized repeat protein (TIGR01451 family)